MEEISFGKWLSTQRKSLGFTQKRLAEQINCATITVRKIEAEQRRPSEQILERLVEILSIPPDERSEFFQYARGYGQAQPMTGTTNFPWQRWSPVVSASLLTSLLSRIGQGFGYSKMSDNLVNAHTQLVSLVRSPENNQEGWNFEIEDKTQLPSKDSVLIYILVPIEIPRYMAPAFTQNAGKKEMERGFFLDNIAFHPDEKQ